MASSSMSWYFFGAESRQRWTTQQPCRCVEIWDERKRACYLHAALDDLLEDVDAVLVGHVLETALDDVVAVGVGAETGDVAAQRVHDVLHHVRLVAHLDESLHAARAVDVVGGVHDVALHLLQLRGRESAVLPPRDAAWAC